jgi:hypothetical protein
MNWTEAVKNEFLAGRYEKILSIVEEINEKEVRLITKEWEYIYRMAATSAFILAGGLSCKDAEMMKKAKESAIIAAKYAQSDSIPTANYNFIQALYVQILFALGEKEKAFYYVVQAIAYYSECCDLMEAYAAMLIMDGKYGEGLNFAEQASLLAKEEGHDGKLATSFYYQAQALKGLGRVDESQTCFEQARLFLQKSQESGSSPAIADCLAEVDKKLAEVHLK